LPHTPLKRARLPVPPLRLSNGKYDVGQDELSILPHALDQYVKIHACDTARETRPPRSAPE
jgi:hypothetical protein